MHINYHIQGLRGLAASLVVVDHALVVLVDRGLLQDSFRPVAFSIGGLGVSTFFIISGFIMISISYDHFGSSESSYLFIKRRLFRIVPTYWIATFIALFGYRAISSSKNHSLNELLMSLFFVPYAPTPGGEMRPILAVGWTLNYEVFFYVVFAGALLFPRRVGLSLFFAAFIGFVVIGSMWKPLTVSYVPPTTISVFLSDPMILLFALGVAIGIVKRGYWTSGAAQLHFPLWIAGGLLVTQVAFHIVFEIPARGVFPRDFIAWIPCILAVAACAFGARRSTRRSERISQIVGDASYSIYLFHIFVIFILKRLLPITGAFSGIFFIVSALVVSIVCGILFHHVLERPLARVLREQWSRKEDPILVAGRD